MITFFVTEFGGCCSEDTQRYFKAVIRVEAFLLSGCDQCPHPDSNRHPRRNGVGHSRVPELTGEEPVGECLRRDEDQSRSQCTPGGTRVCQGKTHH